MGIEYLILIIAVAVVGLVLTGVLLVRGRGATKAPRREGAVVTPPEVAEPSAPAGPATPTLERPESTASRLVRLRQRLARSQGASAGGCSRCSRVSGSTRTPGRTSRTP